MFVIGDCIMYNSQYVCVVEDICEMELGDDRATYYVLRPLFERNTTIKIPVDATKVSMRRLISAEEALAMIQTIPDLSAEWIEDKNARANAHRQALRSGCCDQWVQLLHTLLLRKQEVGQIGKKLSASDEQTLKAAEMLLHSELSVVLDIPLDEVEAYINDEIEAI